MRGDFVNIATQGDFRNSRPALVIQADHFNDRNDALASVTVLPVTSALVIAPLLRITVQPNAANGLKKPSQVMVDKAVTVRRDRSGPAFGCIDADAIGAVEACPAVFLGIAK